MGMEEAEGTRYSDFRANSAGKAFVNGRSDLLLRKILFFPCHPAPKLAKLDNILLNKNGIKVKARGWCVCSNEAHG